MALHELKEFDDDLRRRNDLALALLLGVVDALKASLRTLAQTI